MPKALKVGKQVTGWDTCEIAQAQADYLKEEYPDKTDAERFQMACEDPDICEWAWRDLCDYLTELMRHNPHGGWRAEVNNFGWRSMNGHKHFHAENGRELLRAVLPNCDCTFKVYRYGRGLAINNAHHDSPVWVEWYYISPCKEAA